MRVRLRSRPDFSIWKLSLDAEEAKLVADNLKQDKRNHELHERDEELDVREHDLDLHEYHVHVHEDSVCECEHGLDQREAGHLKNKKNIEEHNQAGKNDGNEEPVRTKKTEGETPKPERCVLM
jgi:hypothetical protein